jgi:hypothetical protein
VIAAFLFLLAISINGCAVSRLDSDGNKQIIGFIKLTIPGPGDPRELAGESVHLSTVGILLFTSPVQSGFSIGYSNEKMTGLRNNVLVFNDGEKLCSKKADQSLKNFFVEQGDFNE